VKDSLGSPIPQGEGIQERGFRFNRFDVITNTAWSLLVSSLFFLGLRVILGEWFSWWYLWWFSWGWIGGTLSDYRQFRKAKRERR